MMSKQRLHLAAILLHFFTGLRYLIVPIIAGFFAFMEESLGKPFFYFITISGAILLLIMMYSFFKWYRFTYKVDHNQLHIQSGLFIRKERFIPKNRIQSIDLTASVLHRLFNLVKVQIETAGSSEGADVSLSAIKRSDGELIREQLKLIEGNEQDSEDEIIAETSDPSATISFKRLFIAGSTSGGVGVIAAFALVAFTQVESYVPQDIYNTTLEWVINLSITIIIILGSISLFILYVASIAGTIIKNGHFTITKKNDELFITRGLLEKKQLTIPMKRIQAVAIEESLIRQPFGFVTISVQLAGGSLEQAEDSSIIFPIMKKDEVDDFLQIFLPEYAQVPERVNSLPKRARKFYLFRAIVPVIIVGAGVWYFFPQFSWGVIVFLLASIFFAILRYLDGGYRIENKRIIARYRVFQKVTIIMYHRRIQAIENKQHKIQQMQQLATVQLSVTGLHGAGAHYVIKDLDVIDANHIASWYSYRPK